MAWPGMVRHGSAGKGKGPNGATRINEEGFGKARLGGAWLGRERAPMGHTRINAVGFG
jgi:hypothetical protein